MFLFKRQRRPEPKSKPTTTTRSSTIQYPPHHRSPAIPHLTPHQALGTLTSYYTPPLLSSHSTTPDSELTRLYDRTMEAGAELKRYTKGAVDINMNHSPPAHKTHTRHSEDVRLALAQLRYNQAVEEYIKYHMTKSGGSKSDTSTKGRQRNAPDYRHRGANRHWQGVGFSYEDLQFELEREEEEMRREWREEEEIEIARVNVGGEEDEGFDDGEVFQFELED